MILLDASDVELGMGWGIAAALLAGAELILPGFYLIWLALAAAVTAVASIAFALPFTGGLGVFAAAALASLYAGRRVLARDAGLPDDPFVNERPARLIGREVVVVEPTGGGAGRVRIGDATWPAQGGKLAAGARARIVAVEGLTLHIEPVLADELISGSDGHPRRAG